MVSRGNLHEELDVEREEAWVRSSSHVSRIGDSGRDGEKVSSQGFMYKGSEISGKGRVGTGKTGVEVSVRSLEVEKSKKKGGL